MRPYVASAFALAAMLVSPVAARAEFDNTVPVKFVSAAAPVRLTESSVFFNADATVRLCVSFRNVTAKPASLVRVTFRFDDLLGNPIREGVLTRTGSFGPGVAIEGKMSALGGNTDSFKNCTTVQGTTIKPSLETIEVVGVDFEDGTSWKKGQPFVAVFDRDGNKLPGTGQNVGGTPGAAPGAVTVNVGGATATGGTIGGSGGAPVFGTIAWIPGSRVAIGTAVDAPSQDAADFAAMTKCNGLAPNGAGCTIRVRMHDAAFRCGVVATDDAKFSTGRGPDSNSTIKAALDALQQLGGTLGANNIVASVCNSH